MSEASAPAADAAAPAESAAPAPEQVADWRDGLPDELRSAGVVADAKDIASLAQTAVDLKKFQGGAIRIPSSEAGQEDWEAFDAKLRDKVPNLVRFDANNPESVTRLARQLGMPEEAAGYEMPEFEPPEGVQVNANFAEGLREMAHAANLTNGQFKSLVGAQLALQAQAAQAQQQAFEADQAALRAEWGQAHDGRLAQVGMILKHFVPEGHMLHGINPSQLDSGTVRMFYAIAEALGGEGKGNLVQDIAEQQVGMSPQEAKAQINEIRGNPDHPYHSREKPGHNEAVRHVQELYEISMGKAGQQPHSPLEYESGNGGISFEGTA